MDPADPPIATFLEQFSKPNTRSAYRSHILAFIDCMAGPQRAGRTATTEELATYEALAVQYLRAPEIIRDLSRFVRDMGKRKTPAHTASLRFSVVLDFLAFHDHEIRDRDRKSLAGRLPKGGTQTVEGDLDHETIAAILRHMDVRGRAICLVLASGGMRIGELLQVPLRDVNLEASPAEITLRGHITKTGAPRVAFISSEAVTTLKLWLQVREETLDRSIGRSSALVRHGCTTAKDQGDDRLFPFSSNCVRDVWNGALQKTGFYDVDPQTNRTTLHIHMLRKFYLSQAKLGAPEEIIEALAGHAGYLSGAYRRYSKKQMAEYYLKAEPHLTILVPAEYIELQGQVADKLSAHSELLQEVMAKNLRNESEVERLKAQMALLTELLQEERVVEVARALEDLEE